MYPSLAAKKKKLKKKDCELELDKEKMHEERALGVKWLLEVDCFGFSVAVKEKPISKTRSTCYCRLSIRSFWVGISVRFDGKTAVTRVCAE